MSLVEKGCVVFSTTPSKISLHSNLGSYFIVMSNVALVVKCCFMSSYMFQVFLNVLKCRCIDQNIFSAFLSRSTLLL